MSDKLWGVSEEGAIMEDKNNTNFKIKDNKKDNTKIHNLPFTPNNSSFTIHHSSLVPKLRFPEFRDAGPWEVKQLGEVCDLIQERVGDRKCILLSITSGVGLVPQIKKFGKEIAGNQRKNYYLIKKYDFAYNKSATKDYPQGFIDLYLGENPAAVPNSIFICFRPNLDKVIPQYLNYLFFSNHHGKWLRKFITIGARAHGSLNVDSNDLLSTPIPLPPESISLPEQRKIADCLSSLDEVIELEAKKLKALEDYKKGLMQKLFPREGETTPRLRFPEFRDAGEWEMKRLKHILVSMSNGLTINQNSNSDGFKVTRIETISNGVIDITKVGYINTEQDIAPYKLRPGDILFSNINSLTHIGKCAYIDKDYDLYHGMNLLRLVIDKENNVPKFVFYLISTERFQLSIKARANQAVNQASINQTEVGKSRILVPRKPEQQKIADCLSSIDELIELQTKKLELLKAHKKGLMQQLFPQEV